MSGTPSDPSWSIGLVGFSCPEWKATLYADHPRRAAHQLETYAMRFNAVEINTTFYGAPTPQVLRSWVRATPADFRFCVKMLRDVTHGPTPPGMPAAPDGPPVGHLMRESTLDTARRFLESVRSLEGRLGSVLLQFPPKFTADRQAELDSFLTLLRSPVPLAIEFRHESWWSVAVQSMLRTHRVCWTATDESPRRFAELAPPEGGATTRSPRPVMPTTTFLYVRWLGRHDQFEDRTHEHFDPTPRLRWWLTTLRRIAERNPEIRTIYGFFDNDFAGHAPATGRRFRDALGLPVPAATRRTLEDPTLFG